MQDAAKVLKTVGRGAEEYVSASAVTDIYYIARRELKDKARAKDLLRRVLQVVRVADVSEIEICAALASDRKDFEDCVQNAVAESHDFDVVITRNPSDFAKSALKVVSPAEFLELFL